MSTSPWRHCGRKQLEHLWALLSSFRSMFIMDLPVLHFQRVFSLLSHPRHQRAVMEPLMHRVTFVNRLYSDFKYPNFRAPALHTSPPRANLVSYSHTLCLLNSAKLFWICNQNRISFICFAREIAWSRNRFYTDTFPCVLQTSSLLGMCLANDY